MINLIQNELIKIVHKKIFYISLIICFLFVFFTNYIYKYKLDENGEYVISNNIEEEIENAQKELDNSKELFLKIENKTKLDILNLSKKYGTDSWQNYYIDKDLRNVIFNLNEAYYNNTENLECKEKYDYYISKFDSNDWKTLVNNEILEYQNLINIIKESENFDANEELKSNVKFYEFNIKVLNYRLTEDINYNNSYMNDALNNYIMYGSANIDKNDPLYKEYLISKYIVDTKNDINKQNDNRGVIVNFFTEYEFLIVLVIVMIIGSIVSEEYNKGTIKQLLLVPYKRWKILVSKYIASFCITILFIFIILLLQFVIGGIFFGFSSFRIPVVIYNCNKYTLVSYNVIIYFIKVLISKIPIFLIIIAMLLFINVITNSSTLTLMLTLLIYISSNLIYSLSLIDSMKFLIYSITMNWDFSLYLFGNTPENSNLNLLFSIYIYLTYMSSMLISTFMIFNKKNIKNT